ncbi:hypothetical protein D3C80_697130 [compost metagenome]
MRPQPRQLNAGRCRLFTRRRRLIRHIPHIQHAAVDLLRHGALLFGSRGDLLVHRLDRRHRAGDAFQ